MLNLQYNNLNNSIMKKLNLLLMMFVSLTLLFATSCGKDKDKIDPPVQITLKVSGGATVELNGADIAKDITVTASEKATRDIVVNITSNAAAGEATIEPTQVTIKQGEISVTSKITFAAVKFPAGTDQKKITVTITPQTENVKADVATTDFLVSGIGGEKLVVLTVAGNETEFNTTAAEQILTVTATLASAVAEEVSIAIAYDGTSENLKEQFKEITAIKIAANALTGTATFKVAKGVEGALKLALSTTNLKVDLQTKTLAATFAVDKNDLTITGSGTTFETYAGPQTLTVSYTLAKALTENLTIALTYEGSAAAIKELFASRISMLIAAGTTKGSMDFVVTKGLSGQLVIGFETANTDVAIKPASLTATFTHTVPPITPLCELSMLGKSWGYLAGFKIGETEVNIAGTDPAFINKLGETIVNIANGDEVKVYASSNDGGQSMYGHVWVDWNKDNQVADNEMVGTTKTKKSAPEGSVNKEFLVFSFTAPENTPAGEYHMRVGTNYKTGLSGCDNTGADESRSAYDLTINYTAGTVEPGEDPTFSLEKVTTGDIVVPATGDKTATFKVKLSEPSDEAQTIALAATSTTGKSGTLSAASVVIPANETTSADVTITFASSTFPNETATAVVTVTATSETLEAATGSIAYNVKGTAGSGTTAENLELYIYSPAKVYFTEGVNTIDVSFNVTGQNANKASADIVVTPIITGATLGTDYTLTSNTMTVKKGENGSSFKVTVLRAGAGKNIKIDFSNDLVTFKTGYDKFTTVTSEVYSKPASPADYKVQATLKTPATVGVWEAYSFQATKGTQAAPIFVTITAKDGDTDVTSKINFEGKKVIALLGGRVSGYFKVDASLKGKTIVFTFTSDDTNFVSDTASVVVNP